MDGVEVRSCPLRARRNGLGNAADRRMTSHHGPEPGGRRGQDTRGDPSAREKLPPARIQPCMRWTYACTHAWDMRSIWFHAGEMRSFKKSGLETVVAFCDGPQGLFSLAQAKYARGPLGQQHYSADMVPSATVSIAVGACSLQVEKTVWPRRDGHRLAPL
eukprot:358192-Chlamydomonas_euryale.AAC.19